jgi:aryl-alcohol dehydrogenase-like predicted oxidoreductase
MNKGQETAAGDGVRKGALPTRMLGATGERVSILAFGAGSRFLKYAEEDKAVEALTRALDLGINYIDTADNYGPDHLSERRVGITIRGRRERLFLATKLTNRDGRDSQRIVEESLKALQVDHVDLLQIHSLTDAADLAAIEAKGGVLEQVRKMRDQKMTRFIAITSHADPSVLKTALERHDFDCTLMALNAARLAMKSTAEGAAPDPSITTSFEAEALPVAIRKRMGILAMKALAQGDLVGRAPLAKLLYYALSLPVASLVVGMPCLEHIEENLRLASTFHQLPDSEMAQLTDNLAATR